MTTGWPVACPDCAAPLGALPTGRGGTASVVCAACGAERCRRSGVWDFLTSAQAERISPFLAEYTAIRLAEGRGDVTAEALRQRPWVDPAHPRAWEWYIRAIGFEHLVSHALPPGRPALRILDLGAGTGWLSHRLAQLGHVPLAIDLSDDPCDGLGAARHFDGVLDDPFVRLRADFDRLPLAAGAADVVVYNAAFHYSPDYAATLAEGVRVLAPGGRVVILDSPLYRSHASGERMVAARRRAFTERYGFPSDRLGSREYLVDHEIGALGRRLGLRWSVHVPRYGLAWTWRRGWRRLRTGRESARFEILVAERDAAT